jgi:hypothetical protein
VCIVCVGREQTNEPNGSKRDKTSPTPFPPALDWASSCCCGLLPPSISFAGPCSPCPMPSATSKREFASAPCAWETAAGGANMTPSGLRQVVLASRAAMLRCRLEFRCQPDGPQRNKGGALVRGRLVGTVGTLAVPAVPEPVLPCLYGVLVPTKVAFCLSACAWKSGWYHRPSNLV